MFKIHSSVTLLSVAPVFCIVLLFGGCSRSENLDTFKPGDIDEIPLMVRFENHCPKEIIASLESCDGAHQARDVVCREKNKKIIWLAVTGPSPYQPDTADNFAVAFAKDPTEHSTGGPCKQSSGGVLDCKVKSNAHSGYYTYSLVVSACPSPDPRVYVP